MYTTKRLRTQRVIPQYSSRSYPNYQGKIGISNRLEDDRSDSAEMSSNRLLKTHTRKDTMQHSRKSMQKQLGKFFQSATLKIINENKVFLFYYYLIYPRWFRNWVNKASLITRNFINNRGRFVMFQKDMEIKLIFRMLTH